MFVTHKNHRNLENNVYSASNHAYHITHVYLRCAQDKCEGIDPYYYKIDEHCWLTA